MGLPEMRDFWDDLEKKIKDGTAKKDEVKLYNKLGNALYKKIRLSDME